MRASCTHPGGQKIHGCIVVYFLHINSVNAHFCPSVDVWKQEDVATVSAMLLFHHTLAATLISTTYIHFLHSHYSNPRRWRHTRLFLFSGSVNICRQLWLLRLKFHRTELLRCYSYPASGHFVRCPQYFDPRSAPWASPHLLSLVTAVNLELSATLAGCFHFFFLRIGVLLVFSWWLILTLNSKCGQLFHPTCALLSRRESSHLFFDSKFFELTWNKHIWHYKPIDSDQNWWSIGGIYPCSERTSAYTLHNLSW